MSEEIKNEPEVETEDAADAEKAQAPTPSPLTAAPKKPAHLPQAKLPWLRSQSQNMVRQQNMNTRSNNSLKQRRQTPRSGNR